MNYYIFKNKVTGETKPAIRTESLVLADEFFNSHYLNCGSNWFTEQVVELVKATFPGIGEFEITKERAEQIKRLQNIIREQREKRLKMQSLIFVGPYGRYPNKPLDFNPQMAKFYTEKI